MGNRRLRLAVVLGGVLPGFPLLAADDAPRVVSQELKRFVDAFSAISRESADPLPLEQAFYEGAIPSMLRTLDPFSVFFTPDQFSQFSAMQDSERKGFGTIVSILPGRLILLQAIPGSPATRAGLAAGDEILAVNDFNVAYLDVDQLTQLLETARQKDVSLVVRHPGSTRPLEVKLSPQMMDRPTVDRGFLTSPGIGYVRVTSFEAATGPLVKQTIEKLGGESLKGLVLDLRNNHGGAVEAAGEIASMFLAPDQLIFTTNGRHVGAEDVYVAKTAIPYTFPVAVLINGESASASEIVSGALQDHDRATILGEPSYGKGLVQQVAPLGGGGGMALTIAFYYTPSGRFIQKPLNGGQLGATTRASSKGTYRSDGGRPLAGSGGIQPDELVLPTPQTQLQNVLDATGSFTSFAGEYRRDHRITENLEITSDILDAFRAYVSERRIQPPLSEWSTHRGWIEDRLRQELMTLEFGVAKGDEFEVRLDAVVQRAVKLLGGAP
jgi:carboxyl-terminal processing protease